MPALNFPDHNVTQTYTAAGITWTWNNTLEVWSSEATADGGGTSVSVGPTPPANAEQGDLWWNNDDDSGRLYVYYEDGDSNQWVEASPQSDGDGLYLSKVNDDTAAGTITFEDGIVVSNNNVNHNVLSKHSGTGFLSQLVNAPSTTNLQFYSNDVGSGATGTIPNNTTISAYRAVWNPGSSPGLSPGTGSQVAGFRSEIDINPDYDCFNIYASGNAPSLISNKLYIGTTNSPSSTGTGCEFTPSDGIYIGRQAPNSGSPAGTFTLHNSAGGNAYDTDYRILVFRDEAGNRATIRFNNGSTVVLASISDYRAKENIADLTPASDIIKGLRPRKFNFKGSTNPAIGFIAHEVQEFIPTAVSGTKDAVDENGEPELQDFAPTELIPYLTKALQEVIAKNEELEARLAALEGA